MGGRGSIMVDLVDVSFVRLFVCGSWFVGWLNVVLSSEFGEGREVGEKAMFKFVS